MKWVGIWSRWLVVMVCLVGLAYLVSLVASLLGIHIPG